VVICYQALKCEISPGIKGAVFIAALVFSSGKSLRSFSGTEFHFLREALMRLRQVMVL